MALFPRTLRALARMVPGSVEGLSAQPRAGHGHPPPGTAAAPQLREQSGVQCATLAKRTSQPLSSSSPQGCGRGLPSPAWGSGGAAGAHGYNPPPGAGNSLPPKHTHLKKNASQNKALKRPQTPSSALCQCFSPHPQLNTLLPNFLPGLQGHLVPWAEAGPWPRWNSELPLLLHRKQTEPVEE